MARYSVKVFPGVYVHGGRSGPPPRPMPPIFGVVAAVLTALGAPAAGVYAWVTNGVASGVASFLFVLIVGLVVVTKITTDPRLRS